MSTTIDSWIPWLALLVLAAALLFPKQHYGGPDKQAAPDRRDEPSDPEQPETQASVHDQPN